jgi:hypothetical protein
MNKEITVKIAREAVERGINLPRLLDTVYETVQRNFAAFGAEERFEVFPEEVSLDGVVVLNRSKNQFYRASMSIGDGGSSVTFDTITRVQRQWVPVESTVERSEPEFAAVQMGARQSFWGSVL